ncbi:carbohydrate ABC transporter permease [Sciscionella marina]|uniref:carbohydrate ABC transporter permease n=1 Tax=Sciscionella marina TaxID=508770 RepID=UPI0003702080|nr:carbohydrate ABC transporter permease [Sciscionella marina]
MSGVARNTGFYIAGLALAVFLIGPFAWMVLTAVKTPDEVFRDPPTWWPHAPSARNFAAVLDGDFASSLLNSALVCAGTAVVCTLLALLAGYPLSRTRLRGGPQVLGAALVSQLVPQAVLLLPIYELARDLGLLNTRHGLVLAMLAVNLPVAVWLLRGFLAGAPIEVEEAAQLDGLTQARAYWRVTVPLARNGVLSVAVYVFFMSWQDFIFSMIFLTGPEQQTAPLWLLGFIGQHSVDWGLLMAASTVMMVPVILLFAVVQRSFVGNMTGGATKG